MPGAAAIKTYRDGDGDSFNGREWDESGAGTGPFLAMNVLSDGEGGRLIRFEDGASAGGDPGIVILGVRRDTAASSSATDLDYVTFNFDANGRLWANATVSGDIAHSATDSGNPVKVGHKTIAHGTNPTAVDAGERSDWYANRAGVPFIIGGHPNVVCKAHLIADGDGAQTDMALIGSISAGTKIVLTRISAVCDNANTGDCAITIGFGGTNTPVPDLDGTTGVIVNGSFDGGAGITIGDGSGIIGVGGDGEELRVTCSDPAGGNIRISYSYYTIES